MNASESRAIAVHICGLTSDDICGEPPSRNFRVPFWTASSAARQLSVYTQALHIAFTCVCMSAAAPAPLHFFVIRNSQTVKM